MSRFERTQDELNKAFRLEIQEFENNFKEAVGYHPLVEMREKKIASLALSLRKIIVDSGGMKSLVTQMGIREQLWFSPICTFSRSDFAANIVAVYPLIETKYDGKHYYCEALFHPYDNSNLRCDLDGWLNEIVIDPKGECEYKPTRLDVIRMIADKEGGAHYDSYHDEAYFEIINNYAYKIVNADGGTVHLSNNVYFETLLAISFEFLETIKEYRFVKTLVRKTIHPSNLYLIETAYRINGKVGAYNKYVHSQNSSPIQCFCFAFDSNGKASYRLIKTTRRLFYSVMENQSYDYLILDSNDALELVFLGDMRPHPPKPFMLVKNKKGYSIVSNDEELLNLTALPTYTLQQALRRLSKNNIHIFDYTLSAQYVLEDRNERGNH